MELFNQQYKQRKEYVDRFLEEMLGGEPQNPPVIHKAMHYAV